MSSPSEQHHPTDRTSRWVLAKCVSLLVGLPLLLHLGLWMTREQYGFGPALALTLTLGVGLSVAYRRPSMAPVSESLEAGAQELVSV